MLCSGERCIELANCKLSHPKSLQSGLHMWWEPVEHQSAKGIQIIAQIMVKGIKESFLHPCIIWMEGWKQPPSWNIWTWFQCPFLSLLYILFKNHLGQCNKPCNRATDVCLHPLLCFFQWATLWCLKDKCAPPSPASRVCLLAAGLSNTAVSKLFEDDVLNMFGTWVTPCCCDARVGLI